jgi:tetratricopeptide (TPR) repeat protein
MDSGTEEPPLRLRVPRRPMAGRASLNLAALRSAAVHARQAGDLAGARALLIRCVELHPAQPDALTDLAALCLRLGEPEDALAALGRLAGPLGPRAALISGRALIEVGLYPAAVSTLDALLRDLPADLELRVLLAEAQRLAGHPGASRHLRAARQAQPEHLGALAAEARLRLDLGDAHGALALITTRGQADPTDPRSTELVLAAAEAELALGRADAAELRLRRLGPERGATTPVVERTAAARAQRGLAVEARAALERLDGGGELSPAGRLGLAALRAHMGDPEGGLRLLDAAVGWSAAELVRREQLRGRLFEARGDHAAASMCFGEAFERVRVGAPRPGPLDWSEVDALAALHSALPCGRVTAAPAEGSGPIFVAGAPGSGARLVGRLVAGWSAGATSGPTRGLPGLLRQLRPDPTRSPAAALAALPKATLAAVAARWANGAEARGPLVDASPDLLLYLGVVARTFPDAQVIFVEREPLDRSLSAWSRWSPADGPCGGLLDLVERGAAAEALADHWRRALPLRQVTLHYEALVAHPERALAGLRRALGLSPLPVGALLAGATPRRLGDPALDPSSVGRWTRFPNLAESLDLTRRLGGGRPAPRRLSAPLRPGS